MLAQPLKIDDIKKSKRGEHGEAGTQGSLICVAFRVGPRQSRVYCVYLSLYLPAIKGQWLAQHDPGQQQAKATEANAGAPQHAQLHYANHTGKRRRRLHSAADIPSHDTNLPVAASGCQCGY